MEPTAILWPMLAMMALALTMTGAIGLARNIALKRGTVRLKVFKTFSEPGEPERLLAMRRNLANLYELPTVFVALCLTAYAAGIVDGTTVALAWAFVASRVVHSSIHVTTNNVVHRFLAFVVGVTVVIVMLVRIAIRLAA
jgi:hypothetical protein